MIEGYLETLITSVLAFAATNIDDIFVLMLFFAAAKFKSFQIFSGQYLGIFSLLVISLIGSMIGNFVDLRYVGLLGLFPIYLGIKQFYGLVVGDSSEEETRQASWKGGMISVALVTVANGGDNIGVYVPLLATFTVMQKVLMFIVFSFMVMLWCFLAQYLAKHPLLARSLGRYAHVIMPIVLVLFGNFYHY